MEQSINISPSEFKEKVQDDPGIVIDVRTDGEYQNGHLAIADHQYNLMDGEFESKLDSLNKDKTYYLYCRTGNRSGQAARLMKKNGFENVYNVGGFKELADEGFETE
ncbi:rhodanese-like domain-containing protein [Rhodohalobacter sp. 8-1]|uniref:rhodanese-like domain-containing protein n=1 Tax=Rhodohalobacter sp. 8-1 TaxID=3131972 RepID=UPI0030ECE968